MPREIKRTSLGLTTPGLGLKWREMTTKKTQKRKRKKKHNPVVDWLLYVALRLTLIFVYMFSIEANLRTARFLGRLLWKYYHRGRNRALDNLRASFPDKNFSQSYFHYNRNVSRKSWDYS